MCAPPDYTELSLPPPSPHPPAAIPTVKVAGASARVMAGAGALGVASPGPIKMRNPGMLLDIRVEPGASVTQVSP